MVSALPPAPPALVYSFEAMAGYPGWQRLGVTVKCTGWTSAVDGLFVRKAQVAAAKSLLARERRGLGSFGFRTQADRCTQKQAEAALGHARSALRARGIS